MPVAVTVLLDDAAVPAVPPAAVPIVYSLPAIVILSPSANVYLSNVNVVWLASNFPAIPAS